VHILTIGAFRPWTGLSHLSAERTFPRRFRPYPLAMGPSEVTTKADADKVSIRPFIAADTAQVKLLLGQLPELYPGADAWLEGKLDACGMGVARAWVAKQEGIVVGVIIISPKGERLKISNIYVAGEWRRLGIGRRFVDCVAPLWMKGAYNMVFITVATPSLDGVSRLLRPYGFTELTTVPDRYAVGQVETVLSCRPSAA